MRRFNLWVLALFCLVAASAAGAQSQPSSVEATLAPLTDAQVREMLREKLAAEAARAEAPRPDLFGGILLRLREAGQALQDRRQVIQRALDESRSSLQDALDKLTGGEGWPEVGRGILVFIASIAAGLGAEFAVARLIRREPVSDICDGRPSYGTRLARAGHYIVAGSIHLVVFASVTYGVSLIFLPRVEPLREMVMTLSLIVLAARVYALLADTVLAPASRERRIADTGDDNGLALMRGLVAIGTALTAIAALQELFGLIGVPPTLLALFQVACGAVLAAGIILILTVRGIARRLAGLQAARRALFATLVAIGWAVWAIDTLVGWNGAAGTLVLALILLILLPLMEAALRGILSGVDELRGPIGATPQARARQQRFDDAILVVLRIVVGLGAAALVAQAGGLGAGSMFETGIGRRILDGAVSIATTVLVAAIAWEAISIAIDRKLGARFAGAAAHHDPEDETANVASRAETLLPLLRSFLWFAMVAIVGMIGLSSVGVNIGPLLAGAGVVGLAIGFGAQTLVRDIVSGIFFLIDDAFRVGEYIEFGNIRGEVEKISVRSLTLRHHRGAIHVVPFGELKTVSNYNRDWAIFKMEFSLPYETDVEKVRKLIKNIGQDLMADPEHGRKFLEPLKSQGVVAFGESAIVIRIKFKCKPREQFVLRRIVSQRIKAAFDQNGIAFAYPRVVVEGGASPEVAAAAARAIAAEPPKPAG